MYQRAPLAGIVVAGRSAWWDSVEIDLIGHQIGNVEAKNAYTPILTEIAPGWTGPLGW